MRMMWPKTTAIVMLLGVCVLNGAYAVEITFSGIDALDVRTELFEWLKSTGIEPAAQEQIAADWSDISELSQLSDEDLLDRLIEAFAEADTATRKLLESSWGEESLESVVFDGIRDRSIYRNHVELFRARWMAQHRLFDEALAIYGTLSPEDVIDPAGLFFYRAVCQSQLLQRQQALDSLSLLLNHTLEVPDRFRLVANILQAELQKQKDDDLGHVSRLMSDVERRLDLGRSGERVQDQQQQVITAIDRLLEEAENQKNNQDQQQGGSGGGQNQPSGGRPAEESRISGSRADGEADRKDLKETGRWGMLDRREEAKARELIRQQFPANYLDIISEYNRRIAEQE